MKRDDLLAVMEADDLFDQVLVFHAFREYMRDYELIVYVHAVTEAEGIYSYVFRYCVEATTRSSVSPAGWGVSLDDRITDYQTYTTLHDAGDPLAEGFIWAVRCSRLYPGWKLVSDSDRAAYWTRNTGIDFHEMRIETEAYDIRLIFSDLVVTKLSDNLHEEDTLNVWLKRYLGDAPTRDVSLSDDAR